ncbi:MAG: hypothetical protein APR63_01270 [Desulfuromonas sp. SDB]|nr:MAG: hypothetical protein APR63_01270 [Desulfuromonas sp. SDB]
MRITREEMVRILQMHDPPVTNKLVLDAMSRVPRHEFVDENLISRAYNDSPLPIGHYQTISQPYMVAKMTELLNPNPHMTVLEIGTGSGYQAAVLAEIVKKVYSIERIPELAEKAEQNVKKMGYQNIVIRVGDGSVGWPEMSPFQGIIVTAGAPSIPNSLQEQLDIQGKLVIPIGPMEFQVLQVITRLKDDFETKQYFQCRFVPLIGIRGWREGG